MKSFDLVVIGSGPGGYVAAIRASQLDMRVAIVEDDALGGVCLNWGCIPTKSILDSAEHFEAVRRGVPGLLVEGLSADWGAVIDASRKAAKRLNTGVTSLIKKNRIEVIAGRGRLGADRQVVVSNGDGESAIEGTNVLIATGSYLPGKDSQHHVGRTQGLFAGRVLDRLRGGKPAIQPGWIEAHFREYHRRVPLGTCHPLLGNSGIVVDPHGDFRAWLSGLWGRGLGGPRGSEKQRETQNGALCEVFFHGHHLRRLRGEAKSPSGKKTLQSIRGSSVAAVWLSKKIGVGRNRTGCYDLHRLEKVMNGRWGDPGASMGRPSRSFAASSGVGQRASVAPRPVRDETGIAHGFSRG